MDEYRVVKVFECGGFIALVEEPEQHVLDTFPASSFRVRLGRFVPLTGRIDENDIVSLQMLSEQVHEHLRSLDEQWRMSDLAPAWLRKPKENDDKEAVSTPDQL